jgi:hypothetical protein
MLIKLTTNKWFISSWATIKTRSILDWLMFFIVRPLPIRCMMDWRCVVVVVFLRNSILWISTMNKHNELEMIYSEKIKRWTLIDRPESVLMLIVNWVNSFVCQLFVCHEFSTISRWRLFSDHLSTLTVNKRRSYRRRLIEKGIPIVVASKCQSN